MGDSFSFLTVEDSINPDNSSGCCGFPARHVTSADPIEFYPLTLTIQELCELFWRAKNLSLATDASVTAGASTCNLIGGDLGNSTKRGGGPGQMTRELHHIDPVGFTDGPSLIVSAFADVSGTVNIYIFTGVSGTTRCPVILEDGDGNLMPRMEIVGNIQVDGVDEDDNPLTAQLQITLDPTDADGSVVATLLGNEFNLYYTFVGDLTTTFTFTQFDITIAEYWPYA